LGQDLLGTGHSDRTGGGMLRGSMSNSVLSAGVLPPEASAQPSRPFWREAGLALFLLLSLVLFDGEAGESPLIPYFKPDAVSRVVLKRPFDRVILARAKGPGESIEAEGAGSVPLREDAGWQSESGEPAPPGMVNLLLSEIASAKVDRRMPSASPSDLGFDSPSLIITLSEGEKVRRITVGGLSEYLQQYYVRLDEDAQIYLTKGRFVPLALRPREDLTQVVVQEPIKPSEVAVGASGEFE
jgi:hypothetical protein